MNSTCQKMLSSALWPWLALAQMWPPSMDSTLRRECSLILFFYKALCDAHSSPAQDLPTPMATPLLSLVARNLPDSVLLARILAGDDQHLGHRFDAALSILNRLHPALGGLTDIQFSSIGGEEPKLLRRILGSMMHADYVLPPNRMTSSDMIAQMYFRLCSALTVVVKPRFMATEIINFGTRWPDTDGGEVSWPLARLMASLVQPQAGERIYDPAAGDATLLSACVQEAGPVCRPQHPETAQGVQEAKPPPLLTQAYSYALSEMALRRTYIGLLLMNVRHSSRQLCSAQQILTPWTTVAGIPLRFDLAVSAPPSHLPLDMMRELAHLLPTEAGGATRFQCDAGKAGLVFVQHMLSSVQSGSGRVLALLPGSSLLADGSDEHIRSRLLAANLVDAIIALPPWCHTEIEAPVLLYLRAGKQHGKVCVINASRISNDDYVALARVARLYQQHEDVPGQARWVNLNELLTENCRVDVWRIAL